MDKVAYEHRRFAYRPHNIGFALYYDKIYKKEYLPSRIRYNQFFFYTGLFTAYYFFLSTKNGGSMFCPQENALQPNTDLSLRRYYTSERSIVNMFMRQWNKSSASSHVSKQEFVF